MKLSDEQIDRYLHHIALKDIGGDGQKKLLASRVLIIGAGGLGSPAAIYLAAAGVGTIGIADNDNVELSNLNRQILYSTDDIGESKVQCALERIEALNSDVKVICYNERVSLINIVSTILDYDFVIDATDNFETKLLINDACVTTKKPYSHAGVVGFIGQTFTYSPGSFCLRCVFPDKPPDQCVANCRGNGILGAVAGTIGTIQATEAIKYLIKKGHLLTDGLLTYDALTMDFRKVKLQQDKECPTCS